MSGEPKDAMSIAEMYDAAMAENASLRQQLAALTAQQEPVAYICQAGEHAPRYLVWDNKVGIGMARADQCTFTPLYTAPSSSVREGMMRAAEICKGPKPECCGRFESDDNSMNLVCCGKLEPGEFMDGIECAAAITLAADQVNAAIEDEREACARISDRWENSTISDEIRERNLT